MEYNTPVTAEQSAWLAANKAELCKKDSGKAVWQNRVKMAAEAYAIAKSIHFDGSLTTLVERSPEDDADDKDLTFPDWPVYRDNFILDWIANRIVVTEEEADMIFDKTVDEALQQLEAQEQNDTGPFTTETPQERAQAVLKATVTEADVGDVTPAPTQKRRGRPPGKTAKAKKSYYVPVAQRKAKPARKVAAKKKSGGTASAKAQSLITKYAARKWSRKDIIAKLVSQLEMGTAYAATLYQKFA